MKLIYLRRKASTKAIKNLKYIPIFAVFLLFSCSIITGNQTMKLDSSSNGKVINIQCGKKLTIKLKGNATTGYTWALSSYNEKLVKFINVNYVPENPKLVGAGGEWITNFKILKPGKSEISFIYKRPWEKNNPSMEKFYVKINAKE